MANQIQKEWELLRAQQAEDSLKRLMIQKQIDDSLRIALEELERIEAQAKAARDRAEMERLERERKIAEENARIAREKQARIEADNARKCPKKTFRSVSAESWVEFRLPEGSKGENQPVKGGAYNHYVFPKCNRVHWTDLLFQCDVESRVWVKISGSWDSDALCHGSDDYNGPIVYTGDR
jgi:hypothetical protein